MIKRRKLNLILILFIIVLFIGLGYAYLTTTLSINGTTEVASNTWNVYWDNIKVMDGSVEAEQPVIEANKTSLSFSIHLSKPGDFYEFTFDAVNDGSIDAMIDSINYEILEGDPYYVASFVSVSYSYDDGIPIEEKQLLKSNSSEKARVRVKYRTDINPSSLPTENQRLSIEFLINYKQADDTAIEVRDYIYSDATLTTGRIVENYISKTDDYNTVINRLGSPFFIRYSTDEDIVYASDIGYLKDNHIYYFKGNRATYDINYNRYYENTILSKDNKELLRSVFGESNCTANGSAYKCSEGDISVEITNEHILIEDYMNVCSVFYDTNKSTCYSTYAG